VDERSLVWISDHRIDHAAPRVAPHTKKVIFSTENRTGKKFGMQYQLPRFFTSFGVDLYNGWNDGTI
jgi:hypothetical protein